LSFYRTLGFEIEDNDGGVATVRCGSTRIQLIAQETARDQDEAFQKDAFGEPKGTGIYIYTEVSSIDEYYKQLVDSGIKPSTEPKDWPWGQREFVVRDLDRYKLVFYQRIADR
jgi:uncharacterized glyoxalase superfamily protein PhnB